MKNKSLLLAGLVLGLFLMVGSTAPVSAGYGTTGAIDFDQSSVSENTLVYIHFVDLESSADYNINWTTDATGYSFTTGSNQDDIYLPIKFHKPSGTNAFTIWLNDGNDNASEQVNIDEITVFVTEAETVLDTTAFLAIVVPLLVFAIIVAIYKSVGKGGKT